MVLKVSRLSISPKKSQNFINKRKNGVTIMKNFSGKRLMILGATGLICDAVKIAKKMGIYTVVTDYYPDSPAKKFADKVYDVSTTDIDALVKIAKDENIDGVFTGFSDVNLFSALELCERLDMPFYATREQIDITTNKLKFKDLCRKYNIPTVPQYELDSRFLPEHLEKIKYPVMVKPADSYASKGCSICQNEEELKNAVEKALTFSRAQQVIVERYMDSTVCEDVGICYMFVNGTPHLVYNGDRYTNSQQKGLAPLTSSVISPSVFVDEYIETLDERVKEMFTAIGMKDGRASIQAFHDKDGYYFYEMGFRLTGGRQYFVVREESGIDEVVALIEFALTGKMNVENADNLTPKYKYNYCDLVLICSAGTITRIDGLEEVRNDPRVLDIAQQSEIGKVIVAEGTQNQVLARLCIKETSREKILEAITEIENKLIAYDENNKPMMLKVCCC